VEDDVLRVAGQIKSGIRSVQTVRYQRVQCYEFCVDYMQVLLRVCYCGEIAHDKSIKKLKLRIQHIKLKLFSSEDI
jgi:hypothetical protein